MNTTGNCTAGCWNQDDIVVESGERVCVATEPGYYSLENSNERMKCPIGYVSLEPEADHCDPCPPGTLSLPNTNICYPCPAGTYQDEEAQTICFSCNLTLYSGEGSTNVTEEGLCFRQSESPSAAPSSIPTFQPSEQPSFHPSQSPSSVPTLLPSSSPSKWPSLQPSSEPSTAPTQAPSRQPSQSPSFLPSQEPTFIIDETIVSPLTEGACESGDYVFHGTCAQCPEVFLYIFNPIIFIIVAAIIALFYFLTAPQATAVVLISLNFIQMLYLIGTTLVDWPAAMDWMFRFCGIFAVDLDVILPLQCLFGLTAQQSKSFIEAIPILWFVLGTVTIKFWTIFRETHFGPSIKIFTGITIVALDILYMTLTRTSLEGVQCSPVYNSQEASGKVDWMCSEHGSTGDKIIAWLSLCSCLLYGIGYSAVHYALVKCYKESIQYERAPDELGESQIDPESQQQSKAIALRSQASESEPNPIKESIRPFIASYTDQKWWWSFWLLACKLFCIISVAFAGENITLSQVLMIVWLAIVGYSALVESPFWQDFECDLEGQTESSHSFTLRPFQRLDTVLRGISIAILVIGISLTVWIDPSSDSRLALGFFGIALPIAGLVYIFAMAINSIKEVMSKETAKAGVNHDNGTSVNVMRRKTEQVEDAQALDEPTEHVDESPKALPQRESRKGR